MNKLKLFIFTGLFVSLPISSSYADLTSNLVGWWKLDETSGTSATDSSGNGNTGTLTNGPTIVEGKIYKALSFDGSDDYVNVADAAILDVGTGDLSVATWVRLTSTTPYRVVNKWINATQDGWLMDVNDTTGGAADIGNLRFRIADTSGNNVDYSAEGSLGTGIWQHVAATVDRDSATGLKLYVNGSQIGTSQDPTSVSGSVNNSSGLGIAVIPSLLGSYFAGQIDDVRVYARALTAAEVLELYEQGRTKVILNNATVNNATLGQ